MAASQESFEVYIGGDSTTENKAEFDESLNDYDCEMRKTIENSAKMQRIECKRA